MNTPDPHDAPQAEGHDAPPPEGGDASGSELAAPRARLARLVNAAVEHQRAAARHDAQRLSHVFHVLEFAAQHVDAFVAARFHGAPARDLARRAAIAELAVALNMTERRVDRLASDAAVLCRQLPAVLGGMREGDLDYEQAKAIIDAVEPLADRPEIVAALDEQLTDLARTANPAGLRRAARRLVERVQADSIAVRHEKARAERRVEVHPARDGMAWLSLLLPAADALLIKNRLCQAAGQLQTASEQRLDQLRADLARDLLLHGLPPESEATARTVVSGIRPTVHVTVPVLTLMGRASEPGTLDGYGPIDPDTARTLASEAPSFTRLLTHPVTAAVLDVDRTSYRVPADLRKWLQVRDETCRFPGCARPAVGCDLDHSEDWADRGGGGGGTTAHDNLAHLCAAHHHLKHDTAWSLRHLDDGVLEWTSLTGSRYRTAPAGTLTASAVSPDALNRSRIRGVPPDPTAPIIATEPPPF
jgi:hypothetical protein